jgi:hypothetical protein
MAYKVIFKVKGKPLEHSFYKKKTGRFGAINFKRHLKEVYGDDVKIRITKSKEKAYV